MAFIDFFVSYLEHLSYLGFFILFSLGYFIPVPEEVLLLTIGYLVSAAGSNIWLAVAATVLGVLIAENIIYWLSLTGSSLVKRLEKRLNHKKKDQYQKLMVKNAAKAIFMLRFAVGFRYLGPFLAGSQGIKWPKFQFYNLLAILVYVPLVEFLGYHFHRQLALLLKEAALVQHTIFVLVLVVLTIIIARFIKKSIKKP